MVRVDAVLHVLRPRVRVQDQELQRPQDQMRREELRWERQAVQGVFHELRKFVWRLFQVQCYKLCVDG